MVSRPLLRLGDGAETHIPGRRGGSPPIRKPSTAQQKESFGPIFQRLDKLLNGNPQQLVDDPTSLAPERVAVFEVSNSIDAFRRVLEGESGFEYLTSAKTSFEPDDRFSLIDQRKLSVGLDRVDKPVPGTLYYAVPDRKALVQLVSLWKRWESGESLGREWAGFKNLFANLKNLRPWGPEDRITTSSLERWTDELSTTNRKFLRVEFEFWFKNNSYTRHDEADQIKHKIEAIGGSVLHETEILDIQYHGLLANIPINEINAWINGEYTELVSADPVMYLRPQSVLVGITSDIESEQALFSDLAPISPTAKPIVALFDGLPVSQHTLLS